MTNADEVAELKVLVAQLEGKLGVLSRAQGILADSVEEIERAAQSATVILEDAVESSAEDTVVPDDEPTREPPSDAGAPGLDPTNFGLLYEWVHLHVATLMERKIATGSSSSGVGIFWCHQWYRHPDVRERFAVLMLAWEDAVVEPGAAMSAWYLNHYDPHLRAITAPDGPFYDCTPKAHLPARPVGHHELAHILVPDDTFDDPTQPPSQWNPGDAPIDPRA